MTAQEQRTDNQQIQELSDRQLRYEQQYFDCLNNIFTHLENISTQNKSLHLCQQECSTLKLAHKQECSTLNLARQAELATLAETIRLRNLGIEQLQEELSQQNSLLVNVQAELAYLRSRHPKARAKRILKRLGFLITPLFPISLLRRSKRAAMNRLKFKD